MLDLTVRKLETGYHVCRGNEIGSTRYSTIADATNALSRMECGLIRFEPYKLSRVGEAGKTAPYQQTANGRIRNTMRAK